MSIIDWIIIALFLSLLVGLGFRFSRKNRNLEDYFLGGRSMPTWMVALAATGTSISAGTFVGSPELGFNTNLTYLMLCIGAIFGGLLVAWLFLPKLYKAGTITIYGYIGDRFGETSKRWTSVMFLLGQLFTSGSRLFIAAIAVSVILYGSGSKLQVVDPSLRFDVPYNLIGALIGATVFKVVQFSTDHEFVQRQLTCKSVKTAGVSLVYSQIMSLPIVLIFLSIGLLLWVKYNAIDPSGLCGFSSDARDLFPQYIKNSIPIGLRGLMIVGVLAAALSSFNSAINSMASSFTADLYLPIKRDRGHEITTAEAQMASSKKMAALMGAVLTAFAIVTAVMQQASGLNLVDFATGVMCFSYAGMGGVFVCALFTKRGNTRSVVAALVIGLLVVLAMQPYVLGPLSEALLGHKISIAWTWWTPIGSIISFLICYAGKGPKSVNN